MWIDAFWFQPFESRAGEPPLVGLRFAYDEVLIADLKALLTRQKAKCVDRARRVYVAGNWLPDYRVWFVERPAWPAVLHGLESYGHGVDWIARPDDVPHYPEVEPAPAPPPPPPPTAHAIPACLAAVRTAYPHHAALGLLPDAEALVIQAAYRALAQRWHPDHGGDHARMTAVNLAWEALRC